MSKEGSVPFGPGGQIEPIPGGSIVDVLRRRAASEGDREAARYLGADGESSITVAELDFQARSVAVSLAAAATEGERVLVVIPSGLEFVVAFFGCLYAGLVPVPCPQPGRDYGAGRGWRLQNVARDASARVLLTTAQLAASVRDRLSDSIGEPIKLFCIEDIDREGADRWKPIHVDRGSLALLQYTSGSTSNPKGVMVTHGQLLWNAAQLRDRFGLTRESRAVLWLPHFHDMGLIGGIITPLIVGFSTVLMPASAFLQRPLSWLEAISRLNGTVCGAPNFAFDLCVERTTERERAGLDLSSWSLAFCAAEPIRVSTLERFAEAFAVSGFLRRSLYPCYGLAEATLLAAAGRPGSLVLRSFDVDALQAGFALSSFSRQHGRQIASCGSTLLSQSLEIVDPSSLHSCAARQIGEIWISGPNVASGYWRREKETTTTFQARTADGRGPFLRTGDLGFLDDGQLFVTGRLKDLIIVRGLNHHPNDIEATIEQEFPMVRKGYGAAFCLQNGEVEQVIVVYEANPRSSHSLDELAHSIHSKVGVVHGLSVDVVILTKPRNVPKTSSGKIQRSACREKYLKGEFEIIGQWRSRTAIPTGLRPSPVAVSDVETVGDDDSELMRTVAGAFRQVLVVDQIDIKRDLFELGGDSLAGARIVAILQEHYCVRLDLLSAFEGFTVVHLADLVDRELTAEVMALSDGAVDSLLRS